MWGRGDNERAQGFVQCTDCSLLHYLEDITNPELQLDGKCIQLKLSTPEGWIGDGWQGEVLLCYVVQPLAPFQLEGNTEAWASVYFKDVKPSANFIKQKVL